jgi:glycosyltransferase involved in cell wall biosynthesis
MNTAFINDEFGTPIKLSICIPTYNRCKYLEHILPKCIQEIEDGKLHSSVEILIGDNASPDGTEEYCRDLEKKYKFLRYVLNKENLGCEKNWLNLLGLAFGHYVWLLSDDDSFVPGTFAEVIRISESRNYAAISLNYNFFDWKNENISYGLACQKTTDIIGQGSRSFFLETNFSSSFFSSNIFKRQDALTILPRIIKYSGSPWLHLYLIENVIGDSADYYFIAEPKLKMRALPLSISRREYYLSGRIHFYFDACIAFFDFLEYAGWKDSVILKKMRSELLFQITTEKITWQENAGHEDYNYWFSMVKKLIQNSYLKTSFKFWLFDLFVMLLPSFFSRIIVYFRAKRSEIGIYLRESEFKQGVFPRLFFILFSMYKRFINP